MEAMVRALYRVAAIPGAQSPYDRVNLKIYYPALYGNSDTERNTGVIPPNDELAPFPVVILLPGINLGPSGTGWLAHRLATAGYATVATTAITEEMPGYISISPGLLLDKLKPQGYGTGPSCALLQPVIEELEKVQAESVLAGRLDLDSVVLGGHSAGGTAALLNANPDWLPGVRAAFSYAAHTGASMALGWPAEMVLPLPTALPILLLGGDRDGVIAASAHRYGRNEADPLHTICRTFDEGVHPSDGQSHLAILAGANHFSFAANHDGATGRDFLDWESEAKPDLLRQQLGDLIVNFLDGTVRKSEEGILRLKESLKSPELTTARSK